MKKFIITALCSLIIGVGVAGDIGYNKYGELSYKAHKEINQVHSDMEKQIKVNENLTKQMAQQKQNSVNLTKQKNQMQAQINSLKGELNQARKK